MNIRNSLYCTLIILLFATFNCSSSDNPPAEETGSGTALSSNSITSQTGSDSATSVILSSQETAGSEIATSTSDLSIGSSVATTLQSSGSSAELPCEDWIDPSQVDFFVDVTFSGASDGSAERPYSTLSAALAVAGPNAIIFLADGVYSGGNITLQEGQQIYSCHGAEATILDCDGQTNCFQLANAVTLQGLGFMNAENALLGSGNNQLRIKNNAFSAIAQAAMKLTDITDSQISDNSITTAAEAGLVFATSGGLLKNLDISANTISEIGGGTKLYGGFSGILFLIDQAGRATDLSLSHNEIYHNEYGLAFLVSNDSNLEQLVISANTIHDNDINGIDLTIQSSHISGIEIIDNSAEHQTDPEIAGGIYLNLEDASTAENVTINNNYTRENIIGISLLSLGESSISQVTMDNNEGDVSPKLFGQSFIIGAMLFGSEAGTMSEISLTNNRWLHLGIGLSLWVESGANISDVTIKGNQMDGNYSLVDSSYIGLYVSNSNPDTSTIQNVAISDNLLQNNAYGLFIEASKAIDVSANKIKNNLVLGISCDPSGVELNCASNTFENNGAFSGDSHIDSDCPTTCLP
jgi:parallel beta-helix repeat protein